MNDYLALLRGINVGGNSIIKMTALKECFEKTGFKDVVTFIQSGNVLFKSTLNDRDEIQKIIEESLFAIFNYEISMVLLNFFQIATVKKEAPSYFGNDPEKYRYDVIFLLNHLTPGEALTQIKTKDGVDKVFAGSHSLYFSRLIEKASSSYLSKIISMPVYKNFTIRNWNTTTKLFHMMEKRS